jgi:hypothetical protein
MGLPGMSRAQNCLWPCPVWTIDPPAADGLRIGGPGRTRDGQLDQVRSTTTRSTHAEWPFLVPERSSLKTAPFTSRNDQGESASRDNVRASI